MNMKGNIKARVNPYSREYIKNGVELLSYEEDFREPKLKINDDKRVHINLSALVPKSKLDKSSKLSATSLSTH